MSQDIRGVNNHTNVSGERNNIGDYSVPFNIIFESEGVVSGINVTQTDPVSPAVAISPGYLVIDCGDNGLLPFELATAIDTLDVPNTGSAKYYLVCFKVNLVNATQEFVVVEGTAGVDPELPENVSSSGIYYLAVARIEKLATANVTDAEIVQDSTTETNNSTPELIYRRTDIAFNNDDLSFKEWVIVDFEADDGVTKQDFTLNGDNDDDEVIQAALDFATPLGLGVFVRARQDIIFGDTVYYDDNAKLRGNGWLTNFKAKNALNKALFRPRNHASTSNLNCEFENFSLDGNRANQSAFTGGLFEILASTSGANVITRNRLTRIQVKNSFFKGIYAQNVAGNTVEFCHVYNCGSNGIDGFLANSNTIAFNEVHDLLTEFVGILMNRRASDNKIIYNTVYNISDDGIQLRGYHAGLPVQSILWQSGNTVRYTLESSVSTSLFSSLTAGDEFNVRDATNSVNNGTFYVSAINTGSKYVEVVNPSVSSNATDEATSPATSSGNPERTTGNLIHGNTIKNVGIVIGGQGILMNEFGCVNNTVSGNHIERSRVNGIEVSAYAGEQTIEGNTIIESGYQGGEHVDALGEGHGININNNGAQSIVRGNRTIRSWRCGINAGPGTVIEGNQARDNGLKGSGSTFGIQFGAECVVTGNRAFDTRSGASRTQTYGIVSGEDDSIIDKNWTYNNVTAGYNVTGSNKYFYNDETNTFYGKSGTINFASAVDARGFNVNGLKLQTVSSGGSIGGWLEREAGDVQGYNHNRQTTDVNDVGRFYNKNNSSGVLTKVGGITGDITSRFYWEYVKALIAVEADTINERTSAAGVTVDGVLIKDGQLKNVVDPSEAQDAATKAYVDAVASGLDIKQSVRVATTANITLSGAQTIDGVSVIAGDRVLVKDQSTGAQNGIYVCASGSWSRSTDADSSAEVTSGMFVFVSEGTTNGDNGFVLTTNDPIILGTTALTFTQFSGAGQIVAGAALTKSGNTLDVAVDNTSIEISGDALQIKNVDASKIGGGAVSNTEFAYLDGATSNIQTQIDTVNTSLNGERLIFKDFTEVQVTNSAVETSLASFSLAGGQLYASSTNNLLVIEFDTDFYNNTGSNQTYSLKLKYGATTMITTATGNFGTTGTRRAGFGKAWIKGDGATNAQTASMFHSVGTIVPQGLLGSASENSASSQTVEITVTLPTADPNLSFTMKNVRAYIISG